MSLGFGFATVIEIAIIILIVWGFYNEDKLIDFEDKLAWLIAAYIRKVRKKRYIKKHNKVINKNRVRYISNNDMKKVVYNTYYDNVA